MQFDSPEAVMRHALRLAARGEGRVEPNPLVGAVIVDDQMRLIGEGWHERFGGPHAEVRALAQAGERSAGATLFVTLEPCTHFGKTPPCAPAVIQAGIRQVWIAVPDPFAEVGGRGIRQLREAGVDVHVGLLEPDGRRIAAPFFKLTTTGLPYVHGKWAMTLDGRIATSTGESQWISGAASRARVHALRGRMDAVAIGIGTALADNPLLTARPPGPRTAVRIVFDSKARLPLDSQLTRTAADGPVLLVCGRSAPQRRLEALQSAGVECLALPDHDQPATVVIEALRELGRRRMTNVLVEGGSGLLGSFFDAGAVDETHLFVGPQVVGGRSARSPVAGRGQSVLALAQRFELAAVERLDDDIYLRSVRGQK